MSNKTTKQNLLCCSAQQQSSITGRDNHAPDAQTDAVPLPLVDTLNTAKTSVDKNEPSNSSATNYNNMVILEKETKTNKNKNKSKKNNMHGDGVEQSPFQSRISSSSPKEKKIPPLLVLSNNSPEIERDNSHSVNENYININRVHGEMLASDVDHKESPTSFSNIGEQQRYATDSTRTENSLLDGVKSMFGDLSRQFKDGFGSLDNQLQDVRKEFDTKLHEIDTKLHEIDKQVRGFDGNHIWTKQYTPVLVSLRPQEIQFDVLGFAFEAATTERPFINSPSIMPIHSTSSHTTIKEFMANTIICGEVTTSNLTFDNDELVKLENVQLSITILPNP
ncbi:unnamed protein product [Rotaria socialis]|uniref:Uncharacterized protein n=1 Tax=Rotaria socialis TaxID=392032 RepID=A0A818XBI7_9BILA|nr:unnamed protein product [Rotaria socialis]